MLTKNGEMIAVLRSQYKNKTIVLYCMYMICSVYRRRLKIPKRKDEANSPKMYVFHVAYICTHMYMY